MVWRLFLSYYFFIHIIVHETFPLKLINRESRQNSIAAFSNIWLLRSLAGSLVRTDVTIHRCLTHDPPVLSSRMQRVNSSTNFSIIAVRDGESGKAIATGDTYESLGNKKVREWLSRRSGTSPRGDDAEGITILVDQTASKAGTVGRNTQEPEERKGANGEVLFEHSVPESKPPEVASDILKHSTISRDQSSANKHLVEDLSLLTKPANNSVQGIDAKLVLLRFLHQLPTH